MYGINGNGLDSSSVIDNGGHCFEKQHTHFQ